MQSSDNYIGRVSIPLNDVTEVMDTPTWHKMRLSGTEAPAGELLLSVLHSCNPYG